MGQNNNLYKIISTKYFVENYVEVIKLWEQEKGNITLNLSVKEDFLLLDGVCNSYYQIGLYKKSLNIVNMLIKHLYSLQNSCEVVKSIDYFLLLKSEIYRKRDKLFLEYRMLLIRKKIFKETEYNEYLEAYEKILYKRFLYPFLFYFPLLFFIVIMILHRYFEIVIMPRILYQIFLMSGVLWIIYSTFIYKKIRIYILKIFEKILCLNYKKLL